MARNDIPSRYPVLTGLHNDPSRIGASARVGSGL